MNPDTIDCDNSGLFWLVLIIHNNINHWLKTVFWNKRNLALTIFSFHIFCFTSAQFSLRA